MILDRLFLFFQFISAQVMRTWFLVASSFST